MSKARLITFALRLAGKLPLGVAQRLGSFLGRLGWWLPTKSKAATKVNIGIAYPELPHDERRLLAQRSLRHTGRTMMEIPLMWEWPVERCIGLIREIEGEHLLEEAMADKRGLVLLAPHLGNWELAGLYFATRYRMAALYSPPQVKEFEDYMIQVRGRTGSELVRGDRRGLARLIGLLREGGIAGILPDQCPKKDSGYAYAPFYGMDVRTMTLVSKLMQKSGARALTTFAQRLPDGEGFRIVIRPAEPGIDDPDPLVATTALNQTVERCVNERPEQYQWEYKRFRHRPAGRTNPYYPERVCKG